MLGFFGPVAKWVRTKRCLIDNTTFRLHYQVTFVILGACSLLTTARQFFGDPITCINEAIPGKVFDTYCWIHGTFTLPKQLAGRPGQDYPHPGVGPRGSSYNDPDFIKTTEDGDEIRHAWYQWVCFVLFFQAVLCYLPHFIWKSWEGGKISMLIQELDKPMIDSESSKDRRTVIVNWVTRTIRSHNLYVYKFVFCEVLNFINIVGQMYLMDSFLGGQFTTYGLDVLSVANTEMEYRVDPMARVFPKMSKCTFHKYGASGTIQNHDGLCILPINIIIEKIYVLLWFWFVGVAVWTGIFLCFRITLMASTRARLLVFCGRSRSNKSSDIATVMEKCWFGDYFILMQLAKNINPTVFHDLVIDLKDRMDSKKQNGNTYPTLPLLEKPGAPYKEV